MSKKAFYFIILFVSVGANIALGLQLFNTTPAEEHMQKLSHNIKENKYVSPSVFSENTQDIIINFMPLRERLRNYVAEEEGEVGMYFEYLPSGTSIGINDRNEFFQASLVKVPMAMVMYKHVEKGDASLSDIMELREEHLDPAYGQLYKKGVGYKLTVQEAIDAMLVDSDNTALKVLFRKYPTFLDEVFDFLDLPKDTDDNLPVVSPKNYASIFRALYLSSYLEPAFSNEILEILTHTAFHNKIPAGVPQEVPVAHKIGVLRPESIFSDCGIVYVPDRPYILCAMVKGTEDQANKQISTISKMVYEYVSSSSPKP